MPISPLAAVAPSSPPHRRLRRRGEMSSLVSIAIAGGIAAVLIIGVVAYGNDTSNDAKADAYFNQIVAFSNEMQSRFGSDYIRFGFAAGSPARIAALRMVPENAISGGYAITPYGGTMAANASSRTSFYVQLRDPSQGSTAVPADACVSIANRLNTSANVTGFNTINGVSYALPLSHSQAVALCNDASGAVAWFR